ncbi:hypothetical protein ND748_32050, partial [Frankia sp. AiPs1]
MSDASGHRRHRRPLPPAGRVAVAGGAPRGRHGRFFALLWPSAALMVCAGFGLEQLVIEPAYGSSGGSSTVAAQPGIITLTPSPASPDPTMASPGSVPVPVATAGVALAPAARPTRPVASASPEVTLGGR